MSGLNSSIAQKRVAQAWDHVRLAQEAIDRTSLEDFECGTPAKRELHRAQVTLSDAAETLRRLVQS